MKILDYAVAKKLGIAFNGGAPSLVEKAIAQKLGGGSGDSTGGGVGGSQYTHALYNGVKMPKIPEDLLAKYPYAWIRNETTIGYYDLWVAQVPWYFYSVGMTTGRGETFERHQVPIATADTASGWSYSTSFSDPNQMVAVNEVYYPVLWSNHDIPNGSATATDIYFEGTDPVPTD